MSTKSNHFTGDPIVAQYSRLNEEHWPPLPLAVQKAISSEFKKHTKINLGRIIFGTLGSNDAAADVNITPGNGPHDSLVKHYTVKIRCNKASKADATHGEYYVVDFNLAWDYKQGGSNGKGISTMFVKPDGSVIQWRDSSF